MQPPVDAGVRLMARRSSPIWRVSVVEAEALSSSPASGGAGTYCAGMVCSGCSPVAYHASHRQSHRHVRNQNPKRVACGLGVAAGCHGGRVQAEGGAEGACAAEQWGSAAVTSAVPWSTLVSRPAITPTLRECSAAYHPCGAGVKWVQLVTRVLPSQRTQPGSRVPACPAAPCTPTLPARCAAPPQ
jgi:hypothetical protein